MRRLPSSVRPLRATSPPGGRAYALALLLVVLGGLSGIWVSTASAHLVVQEQLGASSASQAGMEALFARTVTTRHRCGAITVTGVVQGTTSSRGTISVTLPAACRRTTFVFNSPLAFRDANSNQGQIGLYANAWSGNLGRVTVCLARAAAGCVSNNLNVISTSAPPASTNTPGLAVGTVYGPRLTITMNRPGTANIVIILSVQNNRAGNNTPDAYQQMQIALAITQN